MQFVAQFVVYLVAQFVAQFVSKKSFVRTNVRRHHIIMIILDTQLVSVSILQLFFIFSIQTSYLDEIH